MSERSLQRGNESAIRKSLTSECDENECDSGMHIQIEPPASYEWYLNGTLCSSCTSQCLFLSGPRLNIDLERLEEAEYCVKYDTRRTLQM